MTDIYSTYAGDMTQAETDAQLLYAFGMQVVAASPTNMVTLTAGQGARLLTLLKAAGVDVPDPTHGPPPGIPSGPPSGHGKP